MKTADKVGIYVTIAIVIIAVVFASFAQGNHAVNEIENAPNNGVPSSQVAITVQGEGTNVSSKNNNTDIVGKTCPTSGGTTVNVIVTIQGGSAGNTITGEVVCPTTGASVSQGTVSTTDDGTGSAVTQKGTLPITGQGTVPKCVAHYSGSVGSKPSLWAVDCS